MRYVAHFRIWFFRNPQCYVKLDARGGVDAKVWRRVLPLLEVVHEWMRPRDIAEMAERLPLTHCGDDPPGQQASLGQMANESGVMRANGGQKSINGLG